MPESNLWINQPQSHSQPSTQFNTRSLYEDRKRHYDAQSITAPIQTSNRQLKPWESEEREPVTPIHSSNRQLKPWENDGRENAASIARELNYRQSTLNTTPKPEPNLPDPDYSPTIPRVNRTLDGRSQSRNALKSSRF